MRGEGRAGAGPRGLRSCGDAGASGCSRLVAGVVAADRGKRTSAWSRAGAYDLTTQRRRCSCGARARGPEDRGRRGSPARAPRAGAGQVGGWAGRWAWGRAGPGHHRSGTGMPPAGRGAHPNTPCAGCGRCRGCHGNLQHSGSSRGRIFGALSGPAHQGECRPGVSSRRERDAAPQAGRRLPGASRADLATPDAEGLAVFRVSTHRVKINVQLSVGNLPSILATRPFAAGPSSPLTVFRASLLFILCFFLALLVCIEA